MIDPTRVRPHFPALARTLNGRPVVYFDNPAGTQVPRATIDGFVRYFECCNANSGGLFLTSEESDAMIAEARAAAADFLAAGSPAEIAFGPNMTSLTFDVAHALAQLLQPGDEIVTTRLEHDANVAPWLALERQGVVIRWIDVDPHSMTLNLERAEHVIGDRTRLVCVGLASNAFGTVNDVAHVAEMAHQAGAWVYVDAVHYGPHGPIDVGALGCDLLVCSAYKFFGPHLGILWGKPEVLAALPASHVRPAGEESPDKWETGTGNHEALAGLLGTFDYLCSLAPEGGTRRERLHQAMTTIRAYERTLSARLFAGLAAIPGIRIFGITDPAQFERRVPTASFLVGDRDPRTVARALGDAGIFSWAGHHYALEPHGQLGLPATNRIGLVHYNTVEEIDRFLGTLAEITRG